MTPKTDDLEAVRVLAETLQPFTGEDRERIIRWAREKLGMVTIAVPIGTQALDAATAEAVAKRPPGSAGVPAAVDIKKFVTEKSPKSDVHFTATVAYYHQFVAPANQRKDSITKEDLVEACRQVERKRPKVPAQVLVNAYRDGVLDRGGKGHYKLNSVGENLVAMALPGKTVTKRTKKRTGINHRGEDKGKRKARR